MLLSYNRLRHCDRKSGAVQVVRTISGCQAPEMADATLAVAPPLFFFRDLLYIRRCSENFSHAIHGECDDLFPQSTDFRQRTGYTRQPLASRPAGRGRSAHVAALLADRPQPGLRRPFVRRLRSVQPAGEERFGKTLACGPIAP